MDRSTTSDPRAILDQETISRTPYNRQSCSPPRRGSAAIGFCRLDYLTTRGGGLPDLWGAGVIITCPNCKRASNETKARLIKKPIVMTATAARDKKASTPSSVSISNPTTMPARSVRLMQIRVLTAFSPFGPIIACPSWLRQYRKCTPVAGRDGRLGGGAASYALGFFIADCAVSIAINQAISKFTITRHI
jgi:hypothetical protein